MKLNIIKFDRFVRAHDALQSPWRLTAQDEGLVATLSELDGKMDDYEPHRDNSEVFLGFRKVR